MTSHRLCWRMWFCCVIVSLTTEQFFSLWIMPLALYVLATITPMSNWTTLLLQPHGLSVCLCFSYTHLFSLTIHLCLVSSLSGWRALGSFTADKTDKSSALRQRRHKQEERSDAGHYWRETRPDAPMRRRAEEEWKNAFNMCFCHVLDLFE